MEKIEARMNELSKVKIEKCEITNTALFDTGAATLSDGRMFDNLPKFCAVQFVMWPSSVSFIRAELWLPAENWNGRFLGTGNGGSAGRISYEALADGVREGYAVANTDMGTSPDVDDLIGQPERWADFGHRATHLMTTVSKELIARFYGRPAKYSYFVGCSTGGQQALSEAQRYPEDYDGIVAGVPANNRTLLHAYFLWNYQALHTKDESNMFSEEQVKKLTETAVAFFNKEKAGNRQDAFITDPRGGKATAEKMISLAKENDKTLTDEQCRALRKIYQGPVNPVTGERIYTPMPFGSEFTGPGILQQQNLENAEGLFYIFRWVFGKDYDYMTFDFDRDMDRYQQALAQHVNANDANLHDFKNRGGKLIIYSGSSDPLVPFQDAVSFYERVIENQDGLKQAMDFARYFLIPGMGHGTEGPGAQFVKCMADGVLKEPLDAVIAWREQGVAPDVLYAVRQNGDDEGFCRPVYPYPQKAVISKDNPVEYVSAAGERDCVEKIAPRYLEGEKNRYEWGIEP